MIRRLLTLCAAAVAATALASAPALADTQALRPTSTVLSFWVPVPSGAGTAAVLDDAVDRPAAPSTASDYLQSPGAGLWDATVALAAPTLASGETPGAVRGVVYASVGTSTSLTVTLWAGTKVVATKTIAAGSPVAWYATPDATVDAAQLGDLALTVHVTAAFGATATKVFAAAAELDTTPPPADAPAADDPGTGTTADGPLGGLTPGLPEATPAVVLATSAPLVVAARAAMLPVPLACPGVLAAGCHGTIVLRLAGPAPAAPARGKGKGKRARASRCARGCRTIGEGKFDIAAGKSKRVKVKLAKAARSLFAGHRSVRATAVVTTRGAGGKPQVTTQPVTIRGAG